MRALTFELKSIPDLSLVKYSTLGARGVGGVLDAHLAFLRLFAHRPNTSLHLFYVYDPPRDRTAERNVGPPGRRAGRRAGVPWGWTTWRRSSSRPPLAHYFDLRPCHLGGDETLLPDRS